MRRKFCPLAHLDLTAGRKSANACEKFAHRVLRNTPRCQTGHCRFPDEKTSISPNKNIEIPLIPCSKRQRHHPEIKNFSLGSQSLNLWSVSWDEDDSTESIGLIFAPKKRYMSPRNHALAWKARLMRECTWVVFAKHRRPIDRPRLGLTHINIIFSCVVCLVA